MPRQSDTQGNGEGSEACGPYEPYGWSHYFTLAFREVGEEGGYHVRNQPGQKQRPTVSSFGGGTSTRPKFSVDCSAQAIIHGTLDSVSLTPATLLIYDFSFLSYRPTRLKEANIKFEFRNKEGQGVPRVAKMAPYLKHAMMPSSEVRVRTLEAGIGGGAGIGRTSVTHNIIRASNSREMTIVHHVEVIGNKPSDEYGRYYRALWSLKEDESQKKGIPTFLRACVLLERDHDGPFWMRPTVNATADTATRLVSLFATRTPDDPIEFDPSLDPFEDGIGAGAIDSSNLGAVDLDGMWSWTFHNVSSGGP